MTLRNQNLDRERFTLLRKSKEEDLISVHTNAYLDDSYTEGIEVRTLLTNKSDSNLALANYLYQHIQDEQVLSRRFSTKRNSLLKEAKSDYKYVGYARKGGKVFKA